MSELVAYLNKWWESMSPPPAPPSLDPTEQPCAMTYEEVMQCAPRRRLYTEDLDDASSSGDEGDDDDDPRCRPTESSSGDDEPDQTLRSPRLGVEESKESDDDPVPRRLPSVETPKTPKRPEAASVDVDGDDLFTPHQR